MSNVVKQEELIEKILRLKEPNVFLERIQKKIEEERKKRQYFYDEVAEFKKSEFIGGEIVVHSPVKKEHNDVLLNLVSIITTYVRIKKLGYVGIEKVLVSLSRNDYEPDLCFFGKEKASQFRDDQSIFPAPDLVVEILSKSTRQNDYGIKFDDYLAHGVKEYWIIDPIKQVLELYRINIQNSQEYELILKSGTGVLKSEVIKGLEFDIAALFDESKSLIELGKLLGKS